MTEGSADEGTVTLRGSLADRSAWRPGDECPIARALDVVGTRSAMLIMREAYYGTRRFDDFVERVGVTEPVVAARLRELSGAGLLARRPYRSPGQRTRSEYRLTDMGRDLAPALIGLYQWGAKYLSPGGHAPLELVHGDCGASVDVIMTCSEGHALPLQELAIAPPPRGARKA